MVSKVSTADSQPATRTRLVESAAALFRRNGYAATGVKAVLADAAAPYGSLYHWFPGGKQQLGVAAIEYGGERYRQLIESACIQASSNPPGCQGPRAPIDRMIRRHKLQSRVQKHLDFGHRLRRQFQSRLISARSDVRRLAFSDSQIRKVPFA